MKIIIINGTNYASTGNITISTANEARKKGHEVYTCCKNSRVSKKINVDNQIYIGTRFERIISEQLACLIGIDWTFNFFGTFMFIRKLKKIKPDIIQIHTIHGTYLNVPMLMNFFIKNSIPLVWTFHDPWPFTGSCVEFEHVNCYKWEKKCFDCPLVHSYPKSKIFDRSTEMYIKKKKMFTKIKNMTIVTPSVWLANYTKKSFLNKYEIEVIHNGIDLSKYKHIKNDFKKRYCIEGKKMILGVANGWSESKGLEDFIQLSNELDDRFIIVLVGTSESIDKKLTNNIISIHKTYNQEELIKIYSAADVFVNPTKDDNFPSVNVESLACGTPVITYDTGGCSECLDNSCGSVIKQNDFESLKNEIIRVCLEKPYTLDNCVKKAKEFDSKYIYGKYIDLYMRKVKA